MAMARRNESQFYNGEGYPDPTAYAFIKKENDLEKRVHILVKAIKSIIDVSGFTLVGRIQIKDEKTGRIFK